MRRGRPRRPPLEAADRDLEAGDGFLAGNGRRLAATDRIDESDHFGTQRLRITDREMPHRIAAVRLETETFGDLQGEKIADDIFVARGDVDGACLERRQPVGVDVRQHAGRGAELQKRDVLALGDRTRSLRLDLHDFRIGEPSDEIDVVHGKIDDDADIRHARRERADAGDGDGKNILVLDRPLDRLDRWIKTFDMADHQYDAGAARRGDDGAAFLHRWGDRLFDQNVDAAQRTIDGNVAMQVRRRRDRDGVNALTEKFGGIGEGGTAEPAGDSLAALAVWIGDADQFHA